MSNPINDKLYQGRQDFCVVALTGVLGSGFEELDNLITDKNKLLAAVREPNDLPLVDIECLRESTPLDSDNRVHSIQQNLFNRKYKICHTYAANNYAPFKILKYNTVLWVYALKYYANNIENDLNINPENQGEELKKSVHTLIKHNYVAYVSKDDGVYNSYQQIQTDASAHILDDLDIDWNRLTDEIRRLPNFIDNQLSSENAINLARIFFEDQSYVIPCCNILKEKLLHTDYYLYCMFNWHMGIFIRANGDPLHEITGVQGENDELYKEHDNIFAVVQLIASIIKGYHKYVESQEEEAGGRICIDSLRNSFEARYLQERFSAFYLINVLNEDIITTIKNNINHFNHDNRFDDARVKLINKATYLLYKKEAESEAKKGCLAMHDVDTCVANAEIHITYRPYPEILKTPIDQRNENWKEDARESLSPTKFHYLAEQWMKFATLIQRPGLFTPDTDERCMQMAYTAKFNSGCISRQVGAVITNQDGSIRTIGWNDPPYGQVPCGLRDVRDLCENAEEQSPAESLRVTYSDYELGGRFDDQGNLMLDEEMHIYNNTKNFLEKLREKYNSISDEDKVNVRYLPYPFCFKKCHTDWKQDEAGNSFHQRAIHAEENAMMQMVKYGGESLKGGIIYVTASPCEICSKKLYQIGVRKIIFIDPYPGIARKQVIENGLCRPELINYEGAYGATYFKLYSHFIDYKDELQICNLTIGK